MSNATFQDNRIFYLPDNFEATVKIPGKGIILKATMKYSRTVSKGGIIIPNQPVDNGVFEKKYDLGEVVAKGPECDLVEIGDVVIFVRATAYRMPDGDNPGNEQPRYLRIDETTAHVIAVLPGDVPENEEPDDFKPRS